ncbi:MAG: helicase RepA family protein [Hyphomonadaceae bacterium]|nr:helicase RepA family protein [Hyphomonadaceae bacterium]
MSLDDARPHLNGHGATLLRLPTERDSGPPVRAPMALEWCEDAKPQEGSWLIKGLLPSSGLACFYGPSRAGKSFLALEWFLRLAHGDDILGCKSQRTGVCYVGAEAANGIRKRIAAWIQENGREDDAAPFALIGRGVDFSNPEAPDVEELIELLRDAADAFNEERGAPLGVVVIDTLARATPGADENSSADMGAVLAAMERIGEALGVLVVLIHHTGKDATRGARGHSSLFAALDTAIELSHDEEAGTRSLKLAKQKDDEDGRSWGFRLKPVTIGMDGDGDPVTSCVIEYTDAPEAKSKSRRSPVQASSERIVLDALKAVLSTAGARPPGCVPCAAGTYAAPLELVRQRAFKTGLSQEGETPAAKRTRWNRALEKLAGAGTVKVWRSDGEMEDWLWLP